MDKEDEFIRNVQFGSLWAQTKGVARNAYRKLYATPAFHAPTDSFETEIKRMLNVQTRTLEGKITAEEMKTRMARSFLASQHQKYNRGYEISQGVLRDFAEACTYVDETIFLKADEEGNVENKAFGFVYIKKEEENTVRTVLHLSKQGNSYRIRPEYSMRDKCPHIYMYFPAPEFFLLKEAEETREEMNQKKVTRLAELCADAGWTLEPLLWKAEKEGEKIIRIALYKVQAAEVEKQVYMSFSTEGYITLAGNIEAMEKAVEIWCDLFDKNKAKAENRGKIETRQ